MGLLGGGTKVQIVVNGNTVIKFDASMKENHRRSSPATKFPIENGENISDHIILDPHRLDLVAIITDTPIGDVGQLLTEAATTLVSSLIPPALIAGVSTGIALLSSASDSKRKSVQAYAALDKLQESKTSFDVITSLKRYSGMYISDLSAPRDLESGNAIAFSINFEKLLIVSPQSVNISVFANPGLSANLAKEGEKSAGIPNGFEQGFKDTTAKANSLIGGSG